MQDVKTSSLTIRKELSNILHSKIGTPLDVITEFIEILNQDVILSEVLSALGHYVTQGGDLQPLKR